MRRWKVFYTSFFFATAAAVPLSFASASNLYPVAPEIPGQTYGDTFRRWYGGQLKLSVQVVQAGGGISFRLRESPGKGVREPHYRAPQLVFDIDTELGAVAATILYTTEVQSELERGIAKALEWAEVASKNSADVEKAIGCVQPSHSCSNGVAHGANAIGLFFQSNNHGQVAQLLISATPIGRTREPIFLYLNVSAMRALQDAITRIPAAAAYAMEVAPIPEDLFK